MKIRNSELPEIRKKELERRLIREGPILDLDRVLREAIASPDVPIKSVYPEKEPQAEETQKERQQSFGGNFAPLMIILGVSLLLFYITFPDLFHSMLPKSEPVRKQVMSVSAEDLYDAFDQNEIAAEKKYKGASVMVRGIVESVGRDILNTPYVVLSGGGLLGVQCFFDESQVNELASLSPGQTVTISGVVTGKFGNIGVKNCRIM